MEWWLIIVLIFGSLVVVMSTGLPVAFSFLIINLIAVVILWGGEAGVGQLVLSMWTTVASFVFFPVPMFILLGEIMFRSGMAMRALDALDAWLGRLPGRLALLSIGMGTIFSTMSGAPIATTAMLGNALVPDMQKRGYKGSIIFGSIIGSGGLSMIIPPSTPAVVWASVAGVSVGKVLIAGIFPGILMAALFVIYVVGRCFLQPSIAPTYSVRQTTWSEKVIPTSKYVLPLAFIVFMVTGIILLGVATPSEAAAMGVLASFLLAAAYKKLNIPMLKESLIETMKISGMILLIISGAKAFGQVMATTGAIQGLVTWALSFQGISPILIIIGTQVVVLILGMFMDIPAIVMITVPIFMPIVETLGYDPVLFGILNLINLCIGMITPPYGILLFVMQGVSPPGTTLTEIIKSCIPFLICQVGVMALIMAFPAIALWLPNLMQ